jgi:hypothetical protein
MESEENIVTIKCNECKCDFDDIEGNDVYDCPLCGAEIKSYKVKIMDEYD